MSYFQPSHASKVLNQTSITPIITPIIPAPTKFPLICDTIGALESLIIPTTYQFISVGQLNNSGTISNSGLTYII